MIARSVNPFDYLERCFRVQALDAGATPAWAEIAMRVPRHEHEPALLASLSHGLAPNLLLWTGADHQLALSLKWDYVPVNIRREAEQR